MVNMMVLVPMLVFVNDDGSVVVCFAIPSCSRSVLFFPALCEILQFKVVQECN